MTCIRSIGSLLLAVAIAGVGCRREAALPAAAQAASDGSIAMSVTERGFEPEQLKVHKDKALKLRITRKTDQTCAKEIVIDEYGVHTPLPLNTPVEVAFTPTKSGTLRYGCAMDKMIGGVLTIE